MKSLLCLAILLLATLPAHSQEIIETRLILSPAKLVIEKSGRATVLITPRLQSSNGTTLPITGELKAAIQFGSALSTGPSTEFHYLESSRPRHLSALGHQGGPIQYFATFSETELPSSKAQVCVQIVATAQAGSTSASSSTVVCAD